MSEIPNHHVDIRPFSNFSYIRYYCKSSDIFKCDYLLIFFSFDFRCIISIKQTYEYDSACRSIQVHNLYCILQWYDDRDQNEDSYHKQQYSFLHTILWYMLKHMLVLILLERLGNVLLIYRYLSIFLDSL